MKISKTDRIWITGHTGLLGQALRSELKRAGYNDILTCARSHLDLRDGAKTFSFLKEHRPRAVIHCAALVGGIQANSARPAEFITDNLQMQSNVIHGSHMHDVEHLIVFGSNCMYPLTAPQPIKESELFKGPMEPSNLAYGTAKMAAMVQVESYAKQYGRRYFCVIPASMYGPFDAYDPARSHVAAALMLRFHLAKKKGLKAVELWGSGKPLRELLFSQDAARGIVQLLENYDASRGAINLGAGEEFSIKDLAHHMAAAVGFAGDVQFDQVHPDGNPRKLLDSAKAFEYGFRPQVKLDHGLKLTYDWFLSSDCVAAFRDPA